MNQPLRFGSAISFVAWFDDCGMRGASGPCRQRISAAKTNENVGLATRALAALNSNDVPMPSVSPRAPSRKRRTMPGFRALLGNAYFAGGRFHSAETAYRDSLTLFSNQPQVVLKLALVEIALGKN